MRDKISSRIEFWTIYIEVRPIIVSENKSLKEYTELSRKGWQCNQENGVMHNIITNIDRNTKPKYRGHDNSKAEVRMDSKEKFNDDNIHFIVLNELLPDSGQPRSEAKPSDGLISSIKKHGIKHPIIVRKMPDGTIKIIDGERRTNAAKELKIEKVPVKFDGVKTDNEAFELAFALNFTSESLSVMETAEALRKIKENDKLTQVELGKRFGLNQSATSEYLKLTKLPEAVKDRCREDRTVSKTCLLRLSSMKNAELMIEELTTPKNGSGSSINSPPKMPEKKAKKSAVDQASKHTEALKLRFTKILHHWDEYRNDHENFFSLVEDIEIFLEGLKRQIDLKQGKNSDDKQETEVTVST